MCDANTNVCTCESGYEMKDRGKRCGKGKYYDGDHDELFKGKYYDGDHDEL